MTAASAAKPRPVPGLRVLLACLFGGTVLLATGAVALLASYRAERELAARTGAVLRSQAVQLAEQLDTGMYERWSDIRIAAALPLMRDPATPPDVRRTIFRGFQEAVPDYALLAFLSPAGRVVADSKRLVEGQDASSRPFFQRARERAVVEDVHDAVMLARLVRGPGGDLARFVDIAAPVRDAEGELVGVVAAHLDWSWAEGVERRMREALGRPTSGFRALVVSREGEVLLGPPDLLRQRLPGGVADAPGEARAWPDGRTYLAASAPTRGHLDYPGLGWTVVIRQDVDMRSAEPRLVQRSILQAGGVAALLAALLGWLIAGWIARPLALLAEAGERVRAGAGYDGAGGGAALRLPFREVRLLAGMVEGLSAELVSAAETRTLLVREADHRVKNSLQTVAAVLALQRAQVPDPAAQAALAEAEGRVRAVAEVHRALYQADVEAGQSVDLGAMLRDLCEQLGRTLPPTVTLRCEPPIGLVHLPAERALPVGLLVAELLGNAAKHAFPDGMGGTVRVGLRHAEGGQAVVEVADDGVGADPQLLAAKRQRGAGLGMRIVDNLARRIGATLTMASEPGQGTRVALAF